MKPKESYLAIINTNCYKCSSPLKIGIVVVEDQLGKQFYGPEKFTPEQIGIANSNEVKIQEHHSLTRNEKYNANTCSRCNAFVGQHFLLDYFFGIGYGDYEFVKIELT